MKKVIATEQTVKIPTYVPNPPIGLPMFFEKKPYQGASGRLYPLPFSDGIRDEKCDCEYQVFTLENEYVSTELLPAIGGKLRRGYDKISGYDFVYYNEVIKPALIGLAGPWISGGIEFNWPQHHRPTTYLPLEAQLVEGENGEKTVWMGEVEPFNRMKGMTGITVCPGRSFIQAKIRIFNRTPLPQIFLWWANFAAPANEKYRSVFPPDVEWVNDHDRRAIMSWPIAKGVYHTARPFNYGEGTDISLYDAVQVPSSFLVSQGQSDMDFLSGYDDGLQKGFVTVADHHISPGKKLWHWGKGDFGDMWCSNLTDRNGPYIELMTGVYSDNQPDFTWIEPYGYREFDQFWYPIREIGSVKNATIDAAMNFEKRGEEFYLGLNVTGTFPGCTIRVTAKDGTVLFEQTADLCPEEVFQTTLSAAGYAEEELTAEVFSAEGKLLVGYTSYVRGQKEPIEVRKPVARPSEIESVEELYLNGLHLEQYKQHNYDPRDYYNEGLRRDPDDTRCNTGMARISLKNGEFEACIAYADRALKRLLSRNQHPADTEVLYLKGIALTYNGDLRKAYDTLFRAAWNQPYRSAAYYELALLDCRDSHWNEALEKLRVSASLNENNTDNWCMQAIVFRKLGLDEQAKFELEAILDEDPLNLWARFELLHYDSSIADGMRTQFGDNPENYVNVVVDYLRAGLYTDALDVIRFADSTYPLLHYYRAYCLEKLGECTAASEARAFAAAQDTGLCFPSRLDDIAVLESAIANNAEDSNACYYLGCLFYDRFRYEDAIALWETCIARNPKHGKAFRNLALAYFDKRRDFAAAKLCLETALALLPNEPRLLFEYEQLLSQTDTAPEKRLAVYDQYPDLLARRDDCWLDRVTLLCMLGRTEEAISLTASRRFHVYEGGEGKLTRQHAWMYTLLGNRLRAEGKLAEAEEAFRNGTIVPKSYGEAKTFFNQEAHLYFSLGELYTAENRPEDALKAYETAAVYKAAVSEISLFRALALRKLFRFTEARQVLTEMLETAENFIQNSDRHSYYGVGSPSPTPFDTDIVKSNCINGWILKAYALLGLGHTREAKAAICKAAEYSPYDFRIYAFEQILPLAE